MDLKCILLSEKSQCESLLLAFNYVTFWKKQNYGDNEKIRGCQGCGGGDGGIDREQDF